jgi:hypothetical protein
MKMLDMNGGQLSCQGIALMLQLEINGEKNQRNKIIPSTSAIQRAGCIVDQYANAVVPFTTYPLEDGSECIMFNPEHVVPRLYKAYGLTKTATMRPICIDQSIDGAQITNNNSITVYGVKMVDSAAKYPTTGVMLFGSTDETCVKSRNHCYPLKVALSRESEALFEQFQGNIIGFKELTQKNLGIFQPVESAMDCDLAATWRLLHMGGAYRNKNFGCHLCDERRDWVGGHPMGNNAKTGALKFIHLMKTLNAVTKKCSTKLMFMK